MSFLRAEVVSNILEHESEDELEHRVSLCWDSATSRERSVTDVSCRVLADMLDEWLRKQGGFLTRQSVYAFIPVAERWLVWAEHVYDGDIGPLDTFVRSVLRRAWQRYHRQVTKDGHGIINPNGALFDQSFRDDMWTEPGKEKLKWSYYQSIIGRRLRAAMNRHPGRWTVPGMPRDELMHHLLVFAFVETLKNGLRPLEREVPPEVDVTFTFMTREKDRLKRRARLFVVPDGPIQFSQPSTPTPEQALLRCERQERIGDVLRQAKGVMTNRQRTWLAAIESYCAESPDSSTRLNAAEIARAIGRDRSSGIRAVTAIAEQLGILGARDLLADDE